MFLSRLLGQKAEDRPDVVARVFKIKFDRLFSNLKHGWHFKPGKSLSNFILIILATTSGRSSAFWPSGLDRKISILGHLKLHVNI